MLCNASKVDLVETLYNVLGNLMLLCNIAGEDLEASVLFRIIEVLNSAYKAGRVQIADYISFFTTLLSSYRVFPGIHKKNSLANMTFCFCLITQGRYIFSRFMFPFICFNYLL